MAVPTDLALDELLGEGGTARVYAARWQGRDVCAKVARDASDDAASALLAEATAIARVAHAALPVVLAAGRMADGRGFLVMPRMPGEDLAARMQRGTIAVADALAITQVIGDALGALHDHGLLHRDVKPENILLTDAGPMLIDLGLARDLDSSTLSVRPRGTHDHVAPERMFGEPATIASEVYELATVVWMMIAGRLPWPAGAGPAARRGFPPLAVAGADALDPVLRRALSTRPDRRHASVGELVAELLAASRAAGTRDASARHTEPLASARAEQAPRAPAAPGAVLAETYRLTRVIGKGSSGKVYEAEHLRMPRRFAIKMLHADCEDTQQRARFRREAEIIAALVHPRIVEIVDYDVDDAGEPFMVMGLVEGETLRARLARGPLAPTDVIALIEQLADVLEAAHRAGIVHRDLKPSNVALAASEAIDVTVLDFGISKLLDGRVDVTTTGTQLGTPGYAPPEQVRGDSVGPAADVFALAAIAYEALTGQRAFDAPTRDGVLYRVCHGEPALGGVPRAIERVLRIGLARHPERRWARPTLFAHALRTALTSRARPRSALVGAIGIAAASIIVAGAVLARAPRASLPPRLDVATAADVLTRVTLTAREPAPASHGHRSPSRVRAPRPPANRPSPAPLRALLEP